METSEKKPLIYGKIMSVMKEIKAIGKTSRNEQQKFMFRGIDDMYNAIHPLFQQNGIFIIPKITNHIIVEREIEKDNGRKSKFYHVTIDADFTFFAEDGSSVTSQMKGEAIDYGDKGTNKAMSIALKYSLMQMFLIPTQDLKNLDPDKVVPLEKAEEPKVEKANPNAMTDKEKSQIQEELLLLNTEKEIRDWAHQWKKFSKNLIFGGMCQKRISALPPTARMTEDEKKNYKKPTKQKA